MLNKVTLNKVILNKILNSDNKFGLKFLFLFLIAYPFSLSYAQVGTPPSSQTIQHKSPKTDVNKKKEIANTEASEKPLPPIKMSKKYIDLLSKKKVNLIKAKSPKRVFAIMNIAYGENASKHGQIKIRLFHRKAPKTVANFVGLSEGTKEFDIDGRKFKRPFYNNLIFHRVIRGFMIQGGDPTGTGRGGPGYRFVDEFHPQLRHNKAGMLSMANSGKNTNGSQFFITVSPRSYLDDKHSVFGEVTEGIDLIHILSKVKTNRFDLPINPISITSIEIQRRF